MSEEIKKPNEQELEQYYKDWCATYARETSRLLDDLYQKGTFYNPKYANDIMKDINITPSKLTPDQLREYMLNPYEHEQGLRNFSQYLEKAIALYERAIMHFASMFTLNYHLVAPMNIPTEKTQIESFFKAEEKALTWLKKFRLKKQFSKVLRGVMLEDAKFYYVRGLDGDNSANKDYIDLQEMPSDYCWINGDSSVGYTYAFDMVWFSKYGLTDSGFPKNQFAPEFENWYNDFISDWRKQRYINYYVAIPREKSIVFKWDDNKAGLVPPLSGVFKDALQIDDYKDLLKAKTQLDTWKIVFQKIPLNKDTQKPAIDARLVAQFVARTQERMPTGTKTMASPMEPMPINFESASTQNNIAGLGEQNFFRNSGISGIQYGSDKANSAGVMKYSVQGDYGFVKHILYQFEEFVNYQLSLISPRYQFKIKFIEGDTIYTNKEVQELALKNSQFGGFKDIWLATQGLEPHQIEGMIKYEQLKDRVGQLKPLNSSHTQNADGSEGGRPSKDVADLSDAGENTQSHDSNANKG